MPDPKVQKPRRPRYRGQVVEIQLPPMPRNRRFLLHLEAGVRNEWEPTDTELTALTDMFLRVIDDPKGGIVATRNGVRVKLIALPDQA
jgi:hypothetical protein